MSVIGTSYRRKLCITPKPCGVTGARIPWFTRAYIRQKVHNQTGMIRQEDDWISEAGYLFLKIKGEAGVDYWTLT